MPSDTFRYIHQSMLPAPGTCRVCGSNRRDCVDTGLWFEYEGAILFCVECIKEIVNVDELELMHRSEAAKIMLDNERLLARDKEMIKARSDVRDELMAACDNLDRRIVSRDISRLVLD